MNKYFKATYFKRIALIFILILLLFIISIPITQFLLRKSMENFLKEKMSATSFSRDCNYTFYCSDYKFKVTKDNISPKKNDSKICTKTWGVVNFDITKYIGKTIDCYYYDTFQCSFNNKNQELISIIFYVYQKSIIGIAIIDDASEIVYNLDFNTFDELHPEGYNNFMQELETKLSAIK